ncbi:MAG: lysophospholipid acyltransferase family protein [Gemmatimonadetes bacterium]|nr:lysophospholipid acyltransferase family protein [Gemmatimonadota bacterium]
MKLQKVRHYIEHLAFRAFSSVAIFLPEVLALSIGSFLGWITGSVLRVRRTEVDEHLFLAFPERTDAWRHDVARASYAHLGREAVATLRLSRATDKDLSERIRIPDLALFQTAVEEGRGVILVTGHLGNWEVGGGAFTSRGISLDAIAKGMANKAIGDAIAGVRERLGIDLIHMGEVAREVPRSLLRGRVVAILADQHAHKGGILVSFFGREASTTRAPALFAIRTGAPIFLGIALRDPGWRQRYTVSLERIAFQSTGEVDADIRGLTAAHSAALERAVRLAPEQYFWQHRRWKSAPGRDK